MICERHGQVHVETDVVITAIGPNKTAVMAALRGPLALTPAGAGELVRRGTPIVVGEIAALDAQTVEEHLALCGATTERWERVFCLWEDDGA